MLTKNSNKRGQSILEIIIAVSILVIIATSAVTTMLGSFTTTTLAEQQTRATQLATEGLSAAESLANQNFTNLVNGNYGLSKSSGVWVLIEEPEIINTLFTRTLTITDGPNTDSKQALSTITWKSSLIKENRVELTVLLTDWQSGKPLQPIVTPEPTPEINSCPSYCVSLNYSGGTCRQNSNRCTQFSEIYESGGNIYCVGGSNTCCCAN